MVRKENQVVLAPRMQDGITLTTSAPGVGATLSDQVAVPRRLRLTLSGFSIAITAALDYAGTKLVSLPDSNILILGCEADLELVKGEVTNGLEDTTDINVGIGTAVASNATLSSTMQDVLEVAAFTATDASPAYDLHSADNSTSVLPIPLADGASNGLWLNLAATITADDALTVSGTVDIFYLDLGNKTS